MMSKPIDEATLATVAGIIAGFCAVVLTFRLQRHLEQLPIEVDEHSWLPYADWLLIAATVISLLCVVAPLLMFELPNLRLPRAACAAACILLAGYVFAILAHYRLIFGAGQRYMTPPVRRETASAEWAFVAISCVLALASALVAWFA